MSSGGGTVFQFEGGCDSSWGMHEMLRACSGESVHLSRVELARRSREVGEIGGFLKYRYDAIRGVSYRARPLGWGSIGVIMYVKVWFERAG